jgi:tetratricopeptide (TPR) repeat protein
MEEWLFWGENGEFGPFRKQKDGWPNEGDVMRGFRLKNGMSPEELAQCYGEELAKQDKRLANTRITARWICKMEQKNQVPADFTRRRILAKLLNIPPALLGLATLEQILPKLAEKPTTARVVAPAILKPHSHISLEGYKDQIRTFWTLNETSQAHSVLSNALASVQQLEDLEKQSAGDLQVYVRELLYGYYRLASRVYRDMVDSPNAYRSANLAVRVARNLNRNDLLATALYNRGVVRMAWGRNGDKVVTQGIIEPNRERFTEALRDFQQALPLAHPKLQGLLLLWISRVQGLLCRSVTDITLALNNLEQAGKFIGKEETSSDFYTNVLQQGVAGGIDEEEYILCRALTLNNVGLPEQAIEAFESLEKLDAKKRRGKDQTRHHAWLEAVEAQAYLQMKEYPLATTKATSSFLVLKDINSLNNITYVQSITESLLTSPYGNQKEVKGLERMITRYHQARRRKGQ